MAHSRYLSLDVLRGVAILGTLGTNIWIYTDPQGLVGYLQGTPETRWRPVELTLQLMTQGKFLGLLTVMFGIGLALQQRSARRAGLPWPGSYPWRAALLLLDGVVHFVLMTEFDVLTGYAITGWIVAYLLVTSVRAQRRIIAVAAAAHVTLLTAVTTLLLTQHSTVSPRDTLSPNPYADGSWWDLALFRLDNAALFRAETVFIFPMSIALFLVGAQLFGAGVLDARGYHLRRRLMILGFGVALPADIVIEVAAPGGIGVLVSRYGTAPVVALGLLAAIAAFYAQRPDHRPGVTGRRLTEIGRMALSAYVLQNLTASAICYGWGLGVAASVPPQDRVPVTVAVYLVVVAVVMCFAHLWLRRFDRGPIEWLWNASYRRLAAETDTRARDPI